MVDRVDLEEKDVKMTGTNETVPAPVNTGSNKRKQDKNQKGEDKDTKDVEDDVKTPKGEGGKDTLMKEHIDTIFEGDEFSEEFKEKVTIIFEAAVGEEVDKRAAEIKESLESTMNENIEEYVQEEIDKISEAMDSYLDIVVENWMKENKLAMESARKVEMAESIIEGVSYVFKENNMEIDQEDVDHVAELEEEVEKLNGTVNTLMETVKASRNALKDYEKREVIESVGEGLSSTDRDRLVKLTESIDYDDKDEFTKKASIIKENFFGEAGTSSNHADDELEELNETVEDKEPKLKNPSMKSLVERMRPDSFSV